MSFSAPEVPQSKPYQQGEVPGSKLYSQGEVPQSKLYSQEEASQSKPYSYGEAKRNQALVKLHASVSPVLPPVPLLKTYRMCHYLDCRQTISPPIVTGGVDSKMCAEHYQEYLAPLLNLSFFRGQQHAINQTYIYQPYTEVESQQ